MHEHGTSSHDSHNHDLSDSAKSISTAFWLNTIFIILELIAGLLTNSMAVLTDAIHDLGDSIALAISWITERLSTRGRTEKLTFGYKRYSTAGAFISAVILFVGSAIIMGEAVQRVLNPEEVFAPGMLAIAIVGVVINGIAMLRLRGKGKLNQRVVFLHFLEDTLGWIAVLGASILLIFFNIPIIDPLLSLGIAAFIFIRVIPVFIKTIKIFLQFAPDEVSTQDLRELLLSHDGIDDVHDIHLWTLDGHYHLLTAHVVVKDDMTITAFQSIRREIGETLRGRGIEHVTLEAEQPLSGCVECDL